MITQLTRLILLGGVSASLQEPQPIVFGQRQAPSDEGGGAVVLENTLDQTYYFDIKIGTPEQTLRSRLSADAASTTVYGWQAPTTERGFHSNESSTFKPVSDANLTAEQEARWGMRATDKITLGNNTQDDIPFWYNTNKFGDGVHLGFGWAGTNGTAETSFLHKASQGWADPRMGLFLSRHVRDSQTLSYKDSELMLGGVNRAKYTGEVNMYPFQPGPDGGWSVPLERVIVNGNTVYLDLNDTGASSFPHPNNTDQTTPSTGQAVKAELSTYTSFISSPEQAVSAIYANIPGAVHNNGSWQIPCNTSSGIDVRFAGPFSISAGTCMGNIVGAEYGWSLGFSFLKNVYTVFDFQAQAVGFAQLSPDAQPDVEGTPQPTLPTSWAVRAAGISNVVMACAAALVFLWL